MLKIQCYGESTDQPTFTSVIVPGQKSIDKKSDTFNLITNFTICADGLAALHASFGKLPNDPFKTYNNT